MARGAQMQRLPRILVPALVVVFACSPAFAGFKIKAPAPGKSDFKRAVRASNAVQREVPISLTATNRPAVKTVIKDGVVHEMGKVIANVNYDEFMKRMDPADWSLNLPQRWGGQVVRMKDTRSPERDGRGAVLQQERMVLGVPALDMTKNSVVTVGKNRSLIRWQVTHSDRSLPALFHKTVKMDNGWIEFARTADNKVEITTRSAHSISTLPSVLLEKAAPRLSSKIFALSLKSYFTSTVKRYQQIAEGQKAAKSLQ
jgi:hypothetical protein